MRSGDNVMLVTENDGNGPASFTAIADFSLDDAVHDYLAMKSQTPRSPSAFVDFLVARGLVARRVVREIVVGEYDRWTTRPETDELLYTRKRVRELTAAFARSDPESYSHRELTTLLDMTARDLVALEMSYVPPRNP